MREILREDMEMNISSWELPHKSRNFPFLFGFPRENPIISPAFSKLNQDTCNLLYINCTVHKSIILFTFSCAKNYFPKNRVSDWKSKKQFLRSRKIKIGTKIKLLMSYTIQFDEFFRMTYKLRWQTLMQPTHFVPRKHDFGLSSVGISG